MSDFNQKKVSEPVCKTPFIFTNSISQTTSAIINEWELFILFQMNAG